eukprot:CAMPEP_0194499718 /NCGR_PEP_ID=MMETSP0253-20130528/15939_1 /TAXON_ID=2966 /ORGANISM="Noctiluca scintillans" /LENGTH=74 /DNA_ID=CAMNT_0039341493 /DNA_START=24 /DNA_END=248 /DNA_ORIENTATION=-
MECVWMKSSFGASEDDLRSLLPVGFKEFRDELEGKKEQCPLPDFTRSDLWLRRERHDREATLAQDSTELRACTQ